MKAAIVLSGALATIAAPAEAGGAPLFESPEPLSIRIESAWSELIRRPESGRARGGRLVYTSPTGEEVGLEARVITRGKTRLEVCRFPLLTLELDRERIQGTLFESDPIVHLTAQCRDQGLYQRYLVHEYLAYRAFHLLTDQALRVRWLAFEYHDPARGGRARTRDAFLVEDLGVAATRLGLEWVRPPTVPLSALDPEAWALFVLYQYMIGNTDWSVRAGPEGEGCCHNVAMLGRSGRLSALVPVPFDLDSSGLVGAHYSAPDRRLGTASTRERVYRGHCQLNPRLEGARARIDAMRQPILELFSDSERLQPATRKRTVRYLEAFFEIIDDPEKLSARVLERCRPD